MSVTVVTTSWGAAAPLPIRQKFRTAAIALLIIVAMTAAGCQDSPNTELVHFVPAKPDPASARPGFCFGSSLTVPNRSDAWRCSAADQLYDPCFSVDAEVIVCGADPSREMNGFQLELTAPLPGHDEAPSSPGSTDGWMIKLTDETICTYATGGTVVVDGKRANYACGDSRWIMGSLTRSDQWTAQVASLTPTDAGWRVEDTRIVGVSVVWQ